MKSDGRFLSFSHSDLRSNTAMPSEVYTHCPFVGGTGTGLSTTCADCVNECTKPSCPAVELTAQCTDKCVVIACTDISHGETTCPGDDKRICDTAANCLDCTGFEEFFQCCTSDHTYSSGLRACGSEPPLSWDPSFDELLCRCTEQNVPATAGVERHFDLSQANFNDPNTSLFISPPTTPTCTSATDSFSPLIQCPTHIPEGGRQITPPSCDPDPGALTCMWGGCYASFPSLSELVGHVNLQHLRPFSPSGPAMTAPPQGKFQLPENTAGPSCHWADCNVYPSPNSIPGPSSGNQVDSALDLLAAHLLHDHLGLSTRESALSGSTAPVAFQSDKIGFDEITSSNFPDPSHFSPPHECSGPHICHWQSCKQAYSSCEDLTEHMVAFHVGAGKSRYECFWKDCNRNGENGFSSKQKICRHLQSHTGHRPFQCKICKQNFFEAATLQQHIRRHTQEKPYLCDFPGCGKAFAITGALTIHKRAHNGDKPFRCKYCDRSFAESSNLSKHLRTHTGARPYVCKEEGCNKSFARPDQLNRHSSVHRRRKSDAGRDLVGK